MQQLPMTCSEEAEQINAKVSSDDHVTPSGNDLQASKITPDTQPHSAPDNDVFCSFRLQSGLPCESEEDCQVSDKEGPEFVSGDTDGASSTKTCQIDPHCVIYSCTSATHNNSNKEGNITATTPSHQEVLTISGPCGRRCILSEARVVSAALARGGRYLVVRLNTAAVPSRGPCWCGQCSLLIHPSE